MEKTCTKCKKTKAIKCFSLEKTGRDGKRTVCKECMNSYCREWRKQNPGRNKELYDAWRERHLDIKKYGREQSRRWRQENHKKFLATVRKRNKERIATDPEYKIKRNLRKRIWALLNGIKPKDLSAVRDLGCSVTELRLYLENYFSLYPGMSWGNYGSKWHIDHFLPLSSFDLTDSTQFLEACSYLNLQPLWIEDNLKKGAKF